jgi:tRNA dimethylallyltransferase
VLAERIAERFAAMAAAGLLDEVRALATRPAGIAHTAEQAIGYREVLAFLRGELPSAAAAFDLAVRRTRQFARRQRMWFRRDPRIRWVAAEKLATRNPAVLATWTGSVPAPTP